MVDLAVSRDDLIDCSMTIRVWQIFMTWSKTNLLIWVRTHVFVRMALRTGLDPGIKSV